MQTLARLLRHPATAWSLVILPGLWPVWPLFVVPDFTVLTDPLKYILLHWGLVACVLLAVVLTILMMFVAGYRMN